MSKMVRLDEDVYSALKARALCEGKTLSEAVDTLMHTAKDHASTEKRLESLESKIDALTQQFCETTSSAAPREKIKGRGRDSNPRRGLHRAAF